MNLNSKSSLINIFLLVVALGALIFAFSEKSKASKVTIRMLELEVEAAEAIRAQESAIQEAFKQRELALEAQQQAEACANQNASNQN